MTAPTRTAPGFIAGDRPQIVTSRFGYADSLHARRATSRTGGYEGAARRR